VSEIILDGSRIDAIVCEFETGAVSEHVGVDRKADVCGLSQAGEHLAKTRRCARGSPLRGERERGRGPLLSLESTKCPVRRLEYVG
jgi:hypothetical protein